jgi:DNA-binding TFAR19-related protein (PDSD5 family)
LVIHENGKRKIITKDEAIAKQMVNEAARGRVQFMRLVDIWRRQGVEKVAEELRLANRTVKELTDDELTAILRDYQTQEEIAGNSPVCCKCGCEIL